MAKIVVIGASGMLGYDLMRSGRPGDEIVGLGHADIEITDLESVKMALGRVRPDVVVNTAALTKTELCETEPERAFLVNAVGAGHVAKAACDLGAAIVYISTDYVFDGSKPSFAEEDAPSPLNVYGASKLAGEILTKIANPKHFIIRTGWLFGKNVSHKGYNFVTLMLEKAKTEPEVRVVNDQCGSPTYTFDLGRKIHELIASGAPPGIYHIVNHGNASWYEFTEKVFEFAGIHPRLVPITTAESGTKIRRPAVSLLTDMKLAGLGLTQLRPWPEALRAYLDEIG